MGRSTKLLPAENGCTLPYVSVKPGDLKKKISDSGCFPFYNLTLSPEQEQENGINKIIFLIFFLFIIIRVPLNDIAEI
jgi:hypothetical protein